MYWSRYKDSYLDRISLALGKRSRAIKAKTLSAHLNRVVEETDGSRVEVFEFVVGTIVPMNGSMRIKIWPDRWADIDARISSKSGWMLDWTESGRLVDIDVRSLVRAIEETIDAIDSDSTRATAKLNGIWDRLLAKGPKPV